MESSLTEKYSPSAEEFKNLIAWNEEFEKLNEALSQMHQNDANPFGSVTLYANTMILPIKTKLEYGISHSRYSLFMLFEAQIIHLGGPCVCFTFTHTSCYLWMPQCSREASHKSFIFLWREFIVKFGGRLNKIKKMPWEKTHSVPLNCAYRLLLDWIYFATCETDEKPQWTIMQKT